MLRTFGKIKIKTKKIATAFIFKRTELTFNQAVIKQQEIKQN